MILLKTLTIENFLSHQLTKIEFEENQKLSIEGRSGAGKSTIIDSLLWCLYNKARSDNRNLVRKGQKLATVSLKLVDNNIIYIITRSISVTGKHTLAITKSTDSSPFTALERTGKKDLDDWIQKVLLRSSYELFTNSIAYPQDSETSFVKSNASKRKDLLLEIIGAGNFDNLYNKSRDAITSKNLDNAGVLVRIESLEGFIKISEPLVAKYETAKDAIEEISRELESVISSEKEVENKLNNISRTGTEIIEYKKTKERYINLIKSIDLQLISDDKKIEEHEKIDIELIKKDVEKIEVLKEDVIKIESELQENYNIQQKINSLLSNKPQRHNYDSEISEINRMLIPLIKDSGKCPSGDACPFVIPINGQIKFLTEQITDKENKSKQEELALIEWDKEFARVPPLKNTDELYKKSQELKKEIEILSSSKDSLLRYDEFEKTLEEIKLRRMNLLQEENGVNSAILSLDESIKKAEDALTGFDSNQTNILLSTIRNNIKKLQETKDSATLDMNLAIKAQEDIKNASMDLVTLKKDMLESTSEIESLELIKEAFSARGIKTVVIDYLIPQLEERINNVLGQMSDFKIRLDTQKNTADEDDGMKEGLWIIVKNPEGIELPFSNLSGGEMVKVSMAISEGLASLMSSVGFRILDECVNSLDNDSTQSFVEVLLKLQEKFPQILCISHLQDVKDVFENKIEIIKVDGISKTQ